jgi:transcriptional regulator with XRE-family HTH domain
MIEGMTATVGAIRWRRNRLSGAAAPGYRGLMPDQAVPREPGQQPRPLLRTMLGDVLRRTRRGQGRTLADVARAARVSMQYLSEIERGRKEASSEVLAAICDALRLDLSDLLAAAGRDLGLDRARRASVIRLDSIRGTRAARGARVPPQARAPRGGDAQCLLAA